MKSGLNIAQKEAVEHANGPLLVVAGAGTGKTKVIVERIARLVESGVDKQNILALTFTEKAAQEMLDRVSELLEQSYGVEMNIFTFNSFGQELLREFALEIGQSSNMRLVGDTGKVVLLREHLDELNLDYFSPISAPDRQLANISEYFSKLKQQLVQPDRYLEYAKKLPASSEDAKLEKQRHQELAHAYKTYIDITCSKNIIDYDDQLYLLVELLEKRPNILKKLQKRYQYILVDEFQDTNPMQSRLLDLLAGDHKNIMAVGDDDQSIYGWRGATLANILEFKKRYPKAAEVTLTENFRSTQVILDRAYDLIQNNNPDRLEAIDGLDKKLIANRGSGKKPAVLKFSRLDAELAWVADDVQKRIQNGADPSSIAILTRRNVGVQRVHQVLDNHGVEHTIAGVTNDIYRQPIIATMIEALKAVADPHDDQALYHTLSGALFKLDGVELGSISAAARRSHIPLHEALADNAEYSKALEQIVAWRSAAHELTVGSMAYRMLDESGFKTELYNAAQTNDGAAFRVQVLGQWFSSLRDFEFVTDVASAVNYLQNLEALKAEGETIADDTAHVQSETPIVMSVHKAKGLEWSIVYIVDCTEYTFPLRRFSSSLDVPSELSQVSAADDHYNEERRLMYVATTRARDELILTHSESHNGITMRKPSRFLAEMFGDIDEQLADQSSGQTSLELFNGTTQRSGKIYLPPDMLNGDTLTLTASQANDYLRCPQDFKYRHILNVPPEPDPNRIVGILFHTFIQRIHDARLQGQKPPTAASLLKELKDSWPREGYPSAKQRDRARTAAEKSFTALYERLIHETAPISVEESFKVRVPDSRLVLKGRIDAVFPLEQDVEIRDYKTSTSATTAEKAKKSAQASKQLEMYAMAWRLKHGDMPALVSLDFVQTAQIGSVKKQEKTIDNLEQKLAEIAEDILAGNFPPGRDHTYCRHPIS